jgi:hypothetical protein
LQKQLFDSKKTIKRYHKIRWFSGLCDSLEYVLICFQEIDESEAFVAKFVLEKLGQFKYIYILYFLADILHTLAMLSKIFQLKFVDDKTVGNIGRIEVAQIRMMFIVNSCDLNADVFNEFTSYHVLLDYGPHGGYLKRLQCEVRGSMFHSFQMTWSRLDIDLEEALMFQLNFAQAFYSALNVRFCDNDLISCFKILNPTNMPSGQVGLQNWCISELVTLLCHYGEDRSHGSFKLPPLVDQTPCKREF